MREELSPNYDVSSAPRIRIPFAREAVHLLTRLPTLLRSLLIQRMSMPEASFSPSQTDLLLQDALESSMLRTWVRRRRPRRWLRLLVAFARTAPQL